MKTGLVLSGGGARGFAHLGVLEALDELNIRIDAISGSSAGSMCGAFYLAGYKPKECLEIVRSLKFFSYARFLWRKPGILNMEKIMEIFSKYLPETFEELARPLTVTATDLLSGDLQYFSSGTLVPVVCASGCIPVLFEPVKFKDMQLVDGGILNNFPVEPLLGKTEHIIGIHVNPTKSTVNPVRLRDVMDRSMHLMLKHAVEEKKGKCSIFIEPGECQNFGVLDMASSEKLFNTGYNAVMERKDELLALK